MRPISGPLRADADALGAVVDLLGPAEPAPGPTRRYAVLPSRAHPRYLLPVTGRAGAGAHLRPGTGRRAAATRWAVRAALRSGAGRLLPGAVAVADGTPSTPSLRRHLAQLLDRPAVEVVVALGGPRPNRKPVLQVLDDGGATLAWAKLGVDAHTDALVRHEAAALARRPPPPVVVPEVLAATEWRGHALLVLSPVEITEAPGDLPLTAEAVRAIAGPVTHQGAADGTWFAGLRAQVADGVDPTGGATTRLDALAAALGDRTWPFARWHGDLAPWNATWEGDRLTVWDWERSGGPVPLGLDAVHNAVQVRLYRDGRPVPEAAAGAADDLADLLVGLGHARAEVPLVVEAYLATLRARYAVDARSGSLGLGDPVVAALDRAVGPGVTS